MSRIKMSLLMGLAGIVAVACGDDEGGGGGGGGSYDAIANSLAKPTGMLAQSNALDVAKSFEQVNVTGAGGTRLYQDRSSQKQSCPSGGSFTVTASGSQSNARAIVDYDNCCYSAGCCMNGDADWYIATQGGSAYSQCGTYDIDYTCSGQVAALKYSGCMGTNGKWVYVVKVADKTFSVTGSYRGGSGTLTVTDTKGTWTCTYSNNTGSCTGSAGNFSF